MGYRNPSPTVDVILEQSGKILLIRRKKDPFKDYLALPGGFINHGEFAEDAAKREALEETSLEIEPIDILGVYSDPQRDPRDHVMSTVFVAIIISGEPKAKDDASAIEWRSLEEVQSSSIKIGFDHQQILSDYIVWKKSGGTFWSKKRRNQ